MEKLISGLLFCYLVLFPFGQLVRLPVSAIGGFDEIHLYLTDIVLFFFLFSWGLWRFILRKRKYSPPPLAWPIFLFASVAGFSLVVNTPLLSGREVFVAGLYLVRWLVYAGLYFAIFDLKDRFKYLKWPQLANCLVVVGTTTAIFGLVQYLLWPNIRVLEDFGWDPHYYRAVGTFLDPGFTGIILVLTIVLLVIRQMTPLSYLLLLISYSALALTYSRSSYLAYFVAMSIIAFFKKSPKFFLGFLVVGALTLVFLPRQYIGEGTQLGRTSTIVARQGNWQQSLAIVRDNPFLGVGFNAYRYAQRDYGFLGEKWEITHAGAGADSSLLFVLASTGILGLIAYLWLWLKIIFPPRLVILSSALALLVHSFFLNSLFYPSLMAWMWILSAYGE